ncbi:hypothetical protein HPMBJEAJ_00028 [Aeromonas phage avDM6]|nr:hypothetical protein HPMBJEAJ_00028 [Aeromonas phage avDM6]
MTGKCNVHYQDYDSSYEFSDDHALPEIQSIQITYDGGRFGVYINGEVFYYNSSSGNDFSFSINKVD